MSMEDEISRPTWATVRALSEEIERLKSKLESRDHDAISRSEEEVWFLRMRLGITELEALTIARLFRGRGVAYVSRGQVMAALYGDTDEAPCDKIVDIYVCKLRRKLGADTITTVWGKGWTLSERGIALVEKAYSSPQQWRAA